MDAPGFVFQDGRNFGWRPVLDGSHVVDALGILGVIGGLVAIQNAIVVVVASLEATGAVIPLQIIPAVFDVIILIIV